MSAYLKDNIPDIQIEFYTEFYDTEDDILLACKDADYIGFSVTSPQYKRSLELAKKIKKPYNKIIFGGVHPSNRCFSPVDYTYVDYFVVGEGERILLYLIEGKDIPKGVYEFNNIRNLDKLPFPDRNVIKQERHLKQVEKDIGYRAASMIMGRGCPFNCIFCSSRSVWGRKQRLRSPKNILEEFISAI
jgi:radical SAM superfamily enzyme YgiQ (UPF0313 family)